MSGDEEFAHGSYGDYSGVVFYGPPTSGFWFDRFAVSDEFIGPLFRAALDRASASSGGAQSPRLMSAWALLEGWAAADGMAELAHRDVEELLQALAAVRAEDLVPHCAARGPNRCLQCVSALQAYLRAR